MRLIVEALLVGVIIVIVGTLISYCVGKTFSVKLPPVCKNWNKNYVMEISLFFTGFFAHLILEMSGVNKWYCKNGFACQKIGN